MADEVESPPPVKYPPLEVGKTYEGKIIWNAADFARHVDKKDRAPHPLCRVRFRFNTPQGPSVQFVNVLQYENNMFSDPPLPTTPEYYCFFPHGGYSNKVLEKIANEKKKKTFKVKILQREHLYGCDKSTRHWRGHSEEVGRKRKG
ncbi:Oidioi.mRNA.OKI2018_I69.XSR.g13834.t1.cds [Oikopleura dioica]|uniref:Oidioi.mRNA.OKI2018_I69.XSR.g13834.t1.cds n=1 Tax=Oikopleura dioica TaxID=34765 RepID=A0ABN7SCR9_OIKDI|nr:Oidioi.mRNA.OKI2018_I69.XSR.g13834.t1.cds [Oikopleura dioica]